MALQWDHPYLQELLSRVSWFPHWLAHILADRWFVKSWLLRNASSSLSHCVPFRLQLPIELNDWWPSDLPAQLGRCNNQFHKNMVWYQVLQVYRPAFLLIYGNGLVLFPPVRLCVTHLLVSFNWNLCSISLHAANLWILAVLPLCFARLLVLLIYEDDCRRIVQE